MATIQGTTIADTLIDSLNHLDRLKFTDLMSNYNNTIALKRIFKKNKATLDSGPEIQFNAIIDTNGSARHVPLGYVSSMNIPNVMTNGKMPWRHTTWNYAMERRLIQMNSGDGKIIDKVQEQRLAAFGDAIKLFERTLWRSPSMTAVNGVAESDVNPVGIPYFVVKSSTAFTTTNQGLNGTVPAGATLVANINPSTGANGRWCNYAEQYTNITKDDLITKLRRGHHYTDWEPLGENIPEHDSGDDYGLYTNYATLASLEAILEAQNENLGTDIAPMDGRATFMRTPFTPVKELDLDTTGVIYMLNWGTLGAMGLKNEWMREKFFPEQANQPTMMMWNVDCSWNMWCTNRRKQAVFSTATTMP